jgi:hypothetical protein
MHSDREETVEVDDWVDEEGRQLCMYPDYGLLTEHLRRSCF